MKRLILIVVVIFGFFLPVKSHSLANNSGASKIGDELYPLLIFSGIILSVLILAIAASYFVSLLPRLYRRLNPAKDVVIRVQRAQLITS